jgi:hypothetical protein
MSIPKSLAEFLDPDAIKIKLAIIVQVPQQKSKSEILEDIIQGLLEFSTNDLIDFDFNKFSQVLPELPPIESEQLVTSSEDGRIVSLAVSPVIIVEKIWNHVVSFSKFNIDPDLIPDHVYQNILEPDENFLTIKTDYAPNMRNLKRWISSLSKWYTGVEHPGDWANIFSHHLLDNPDAGEIVITVFEMMVFFISMYFYAIRVYTQSGNSDLIKYWTLNVPERQGDYLDSRPSPPQRFVFKYIRPIQPPPTVVLPTAPADEYTVSINRTGKRKHRMLEIYYSHMISAMIVELKRIIVCGALQQELDRNLNYDARLKEWINRAAEAIRDIDSGITLKKDSEQDVLRNTLRDLLSAFTA